MSTSFRQSRMKQAKTALLCLVVFFAVKHFTLLRKSMQDGSLPVGLLENSIQVNRIHSTFDAVLAPDSETDVISSTRKSCAEILDNLDGTYNQRRKSRQSKEKGWTGQRLFDLFEPEATCFSEERFGSDSAKRFDAFGDGPKFVCGVDYLAAKAKAGSIDDPNCLIYSVGSNNDIRFERAVHTHIKGCEVHTFDPTIEEDAFIGGDYATFHMWGLGTDGGKEGQSMRFKGAGIRKSFETLIYDLGHENRTIDILKIDCQGCEYAAMPPLFGLIASGRIRVNQVLIELHATSTPSSTRLYDFFMAADRAKLRITHKERNHWGCAGHRCVEYALTSESFLREANGAILCPAIGDPKIETAVLSRSAVYDAGLPLTDTHSPQLRQGPGNEQAPSQENNRIWINVKTFAEGIAGWRTTLMELLRLARLANCTIVEPCMSDDGKLGSCLNSSGIPVSKIFDLSDAFYPSNLHLPVLMPYNEYIIHQNSTAFLTKTEFNLCMTILREDSSRCPSSKLRPLQIKPTRIRQYLSSSTLILHLEDLWRHNGSVGDLAKMLGVNNTGSVPNELLFHPSHVRKVERILRRSNITDGNFSVIHWRAEKRGMDLIECANAVLNAKNQIEQDKGSHPFIILTSLNKNASMMWAGSKNMVEGNHSTVIQALDMLRDQNFLKFDELMLGQMQIQNAGMLAIYDLILALKSKSFASCARDEKYGCNIGDAEQVCERCNHIGKFGRLAISLRKRSLIHANDSSWGCWPQHQGRGHERFQTNR